MFLKNNKKLYFIYKLIKLYSFQFLTFSKVMHSISITLFLCFAVTFTTPNLSAYSRYDQTPTETNTYSRYLVSGRSILSVENIDNSRKKIFFHQLSGTLQDNSEYIKSRLSGTVAIHHNQNNAYTLASDSFPEKQNFLTRMNIQKIEGLPSISLEEGVVTEGEIHTTLKLLDEEQSYQAPVKITSLGDQSWIIEWVHPYEIDSILIYFKIILDPMDIL